MKEFRLNNMEKLFLGASPIDNVVRYPNRPDLLALNRAFWQAICHHPFMTSCISHHADGELFYTFNPNMAELVICPELESRDAASQPSNAFVESVITEAGEPLFRVCITPLTGGGIIMGYSISHAIGDGFTIQTFLKTWAEYYRGSAPELSTTDQHRYKLSNNDQQEIINRAATKRSIEGSAHTQRSARHEEKIELTPMFIKGLRNLSSDTKREYRPSTHAALMAFSLKTCAELLFKDRVELRVRNPIDLRGLLPNLYTGYMGNAWVDAIMTFGKEDVGTQPLAEIASTIEESMNKTKNLKHLEELFNVGSKLETTDAWAKDQEYRPATDIAASNRRRFGNAGGGADFGLGLSTILSNQISAPVGIVIRNSSDDDTLVRVWSEK